MKLLVGLGNPGRKYQGTRHNVGFMVLAELARRYGLGHPRTNFKGETVEANLSGQKALLLFPHTFMNASGGSVLEARDFYKIADEDLLVMCDDINLPLGKLRVRAQGSAGGQKGLADIIHRLGTDKVARLRIGIGQVPGGRDAADFVLGRFGKHEIEEIEIAIREAADAAHAWAAHGIEYCMNRYN